MARYNTLTDVRQGFTCLAAGGSETPGLQTYLLNVTPVRHLQVSTWSRPNGELFSAPDTRRGRKGPVFSFVPTVAAQNVCGVSKGGTILSLFKGGVRQRTSTKHHIEAK
ncbi:hypothetical protein Bbelb_295870 [Branchiostoma belcheri]|nr:hypothetical protein Bbelb_295870 [Branchiostoma belcheri]